MVDRAQWLIVRVNGGGRGTGVEPSPRSPGYSSELRRTWFLAKAEGAPRPRWTESAPAPLAGGLHNPFSTEYVRYSALHTCNPISGCGSHRARALRRLW